MIEAQWHLVSVSKTFIPNQRDVLILETNTSALARVAVKMDDAWYAWTNQGEYEHEEIPEPWAWHPISPWLPNGNTYR